MRLFVTGSDGSIGSAFVAQCRSTGIDVVGADVRTGFDIRSKDIAEHIPSDTDAIIHLAALSNDTFCKNKGFECFDINVLGTLNLMEAAEKAGVKQFIFASTEWVYDACSSAEIKTEESLINIVNHTSEYALSKLVSEANLRQKYNRGFCNTTILRFGIVCGAMGEKMSAVESLFLGVKDKDEITIGSLKSGRCFIHISDIIAGIIRSIGLQGFEIINLSGDSLVTLGDLIATAQRITSRQIRVRETSPEAISVRNISNAKAKRILNWKPEKPVGVWLNELHQARTI